ncbi:hypothetical protein [Rhizobium phage RHEph12]|nr:hypothetical protein [Rhizobium phage RHEph12]
MGILQSIYTEYAASHIALVVIITYAWAMLNVGCFNIYYGLIELAFACFVIVFFAVGWALPSLVLLLGMIAVTIHAICKRWGR